MVRRCDFFTTSADKKFSFTCNRDLSASAGFKLSEVVSLQNLEDGGRFFKKSYTYYLISVTKVRTKTGNRVAYSLFNSRVFKVKMQIIILK